MTFFQMVDTFLFKPLELLFEVVYVFANRVLENPGLSIVALSLIMNLLVLPLYRRADEIQMEEKETESRLRPGVEQIKKAFKGDERMMILDTYYRQNHYRPTDVMKSAVSLLLQIPFFIAAYRFLSALEYLQGTPFGPIANLAAPDGLLMLFGMQINILPIIMTGINLITCVIFSRGEPLKSKIQLYGMAVFFLIFLYKSPSGLVFYWTLNNVFSLVKTIIYRIKNPKKVLSVFSSLFGIVLVLLAMFVLPEGIRRRVLLSLLGLVLQIPLIYMLINRKGAVSAFFEKKFAFVVPNKTVFIWSALFLTVLIGLLIPTNVIKSSPQEFVHLTFYKSPIWLIIYCFLISAGAFVLWCGIFYRLGSPKKQGWFSLIFFMFAGIAIVNYMFFGKNLPSLSNTLTYTTEYTLEAGSIALNLLVNLAVAAAFFLVFRFLNKHSAKLVMIGTLSMFLMVPTGLYSIQQQALVKKDMISNGMNTAPAYKLSKTGKNVMLIFLDRQQGSFVPYIFKEKPELMESFKGFTVYTNVLSYGKNTLFAAPAVFGGYEYTPYEINKRSDTLLVDKHNESIKLLPKLFSDNGFEVTQFDPIFANYQWTSDLSAFDDIDNVSSYLAIDYYESPTSYENWTKSVKHNIFCYGIMKSFPLILQQPLYDDGTYYATRNYCAQTVINTSQAIGIMSSYSDDIYLMESLKTILQTENVDKDQLFIFCSKASHEPTLLTEPEYTVSEYIDNTEYDQTHADRFSVNGESPISPDLSGMTHYHVNMACYLELARLFDHLREEGVYDNTRIVIVSDHGQNGLCQEFNARFHPILFFKDFYATEFSFSDEFTTNAEVPTMLTEGLIDDARNPYTGNLLNNPEYRNAPQYMFYSFRWNPSQNSGTQFVPGDWYEMTGSDIRIEGSVTERSTDSIFP